MEDNDEFEFQTLKKEGVQLLYTFKTNFLGQFFLKKGDTYYNMEKVLYCIF